MPFGHAPKLCRSYDWLEQLLDEGAERPAMLVWRFLNSLGRNRGPDGSIHRCAWCSIRTIADETGLAYSVVRCNALPWLREHGWVADEDGLVDGRKQHVFWCLWLWPVDRPGGRVYADGGSIPIGNRSFSGTRRARFGARDRAPTVKSEFQAESNVTLAAPGGGESKAPESRPDPPAAPPPSVAAAPAPPRVPMPPAECLAELAKLPWRFPALAAGPLWDLVDQGVPLPAPWDRVKLPPRPAPEAPAAEPTPARPPAAIVADASTEDLMRRLPGSEGDAAAKVAELARRLAREWDDWSSVNGFKPKLAAVARKELPVKALVKAYRKARACGPDANPGAIFHFWLKSAIDGG